MRNLKSLLVAALLLLSGTVSAGSLPRHTFAIRNGQFLYDGVPTQIHSGEMHYARVPAPYWRHRLRMMRAMGLNAVCTYVFWNYHEVSPGVWDWKSGNHNIRAFVKTAAEEGLMVILRPGPYCCAEWEFGGYPWWLQKTPGLVIRTFNQPFLDSCRTYVRQLAGQLRDLQITHGGPLIMVQAENEFGSYVAQRKDIPLATHKMYSAVIRRQLLDAGFDVPLFTSDGSWLFKEGTIEGALPTANGEDDTDKLKTAVDAYHEGTGPYMIGEFYPGWLDHWNEPMPRVSAESVVRQIKKYLDAGVSFNFYMIHGGTNFGFTAGANYGNATDLQPDMTSYDYDAPISEPGWRTPKYDQLRALLSGYAKTPLPAVPARLPVIAIPQITLSKTVDLFTLINGMTAVEGDHPLTFEDLGQGYGYVDYRYRFAEAASGVLRVPGIADFGVVCVNGRKVGELNRVTGSDSLVVTIPADGVMDILVENMGRINYGARITDNLKGIIRPVTLDGQALSGRWQMFRLPMSSPPDVSRLPAGYQPGRPVLYQGTFRLKAVGDTFLDMEHWGKGIVFVNGINLGRYWKVGPQQTLFLPGCYLRKGKNKIVVFEQLNDKQQTLLKGVTQPVLDKLVKDE